MPEVRPEVGKTMKFAGQRDENRPNTRPERTFLARDDSNFACAQSARVIFNEMLICSARP
jgi:hypothetical protein